MAGQLAEDVLTVLESLPQRRLVLFGHSMGACVAFEVARRIEQRSSIELLGLVVSGRTAPPRLRDRGVRDMGDDGVIAEIRRLNGTDESLLLDDDVIRMIMPTIRSDHTAVETYRYVAGPRLRCPISVLLGESDPQVTLAEAEEWHDHTDGAFTLRSFPGGHYGAQVPLVPRSVRTTCLPSCAKLLGSPLEYEPGSPWMSWRRDLAVSRFTHTIPVRNSLARQWIECRARRPGQARPNCLIHGSRLHSLVSEVPSPLARCRPSRASAHRRTGGVDGERRPPVRFCGAP
jgi:hypothetical protein